MVERALGEGAADPAAQPAPGRGRGRRRQRADEGRLVQPDLPRRAPAAGAPGCCSTASSTARASGSRPTRCVGGGRAGAGRPASTRPGSSRCTTPARGSRAQPVARVGLAGARPRRRRDRAAAGRAPRPPPARRRGRRAALRALPRLARAGAGRARPARLRGALPAPGGARDCAAARRDDGRPGDRDRADRRAGRPLARLAAVRAHRGPAGGVRRDRRRPRRGRGRCSAC